jgi:two-component system cell cycle sensor histidine kinase/response regulator CckA
MTTQTRLFVVDADESRRRATVARLAGAGYAVADAADVQGCGAEGAAGPDLLVLVLADSPPGDPQRIAALRNRPGLAATWILVVCAAASTAEARAAVLDAGADDVQAGPVDPVELAARVRRGLRQRAARMSAPAAAGDPPSNQRTGQDDGPATAAAGPRSVAATDASAQAQAQAMLHASIDAVVAIDQHGALIAFSPAAERMFGCRASEVLGRDMAEVIVPPSLRERHRQGMARHLAHGERNLLDRRVEMAALRADGSEFPVELTVTRHAGPGAPQFTAVIRDISKRRIAERMLAQQESTLRAITEALVAYVERDDWRAAMARLLRYALDETGSEYGFMGVVVDGTLRVLAHEGIVWDKTRNRGFYEQALRDYDALGYLEFRNFDTLFGQAITSGQVVIANSPGDDPRASGRPDGHPPMHSFMGVPIRAGEVVQGLVALANRPGGYSAHDQARIETLVHHVGGLCASYRQREAAKVLEREREQARERQRASEAELRRVFADAATGIALASLDGRLIECNQAFCRMLGSDAATLVGRDIESLVHPGDRARSRQRLADLVEGRCQSYVIEKRYQGDDGRLVWSRVSVALQRDAADQPSGLIRVAEDITQEKHAEALLRQDLALRRFAGQVARLGGWSIDLPERTMTWSDEVCAIHDLPSGSVPSLEHGLAMYLPEHRDQIAQRIEACARDGTPYDLELPKVTAAGRPIWVRSIGEAVRDATGAIVRLQGAIQDVTERRLADEALRISEERFRLLSMATQDTIWDWDLVTGAHWWNQRFETMFGYPLDQVEPGIEAWTSRIHEQDRAWVERDIRAAIAGSAETWSAEYRFRRQQGGYVWVMDRGYIIRDGNGVGVRMIGGMTDISERRDAENALRRSEASLSHAQQIARMGNWDWDIGADYLYWSTHTYDLFGLAPGGLGSRYDDFLAVVHPDDRERVHAAVQDALAGRAPYDVDHRVVWPDGTIRILHEQGEVRRDAGGTAVQMTGTVQDITERKAAHEMMRASEERFRELAETVHEVFWIVEPGDRRMLYVSPAYETLWGRSCESLYAAPDTWLDAIHPEDRERVERAMTEKQPRGDYDEIYRIIRADGSLRWIQDRAYPVRDDDGKVVRILGAAADITQRRQVEAQLRQSQKMEAIGRLAGGVAHDFNNLLTVITGYSEALLERADLPAAVREAVEPIAEAGERATVLTRQLLGFSRQSILQPKVVDPNAIVVAAGRMLRRLIGEDVRIVTDLAPDLLRVRVDPGQLDQVLLNLAVNARDAMPAGGELCIRTRNIDAADAAARGKASTQFQAEAASGPHVLLAVSDTGIGMAPDLVARVFDPFFTTKDVGQGSGLGLAMVFGIVQQSGGSIRVLSEPGRGSTFEICLPGLEEAAPLETRPAPAGPQRGRERVLLVEDEDGVRALATTTLERLGYFVLAACDGEDGLAVLAAHNGPVDLVLSDVVMPRLGGPAMVERLLLDRPDLRVLFMSGYTDDAVVRHGLLADRVAFIQKPFTPSQLAQRVRSVLDAPAGDAAAH